MHLSDTSKSLFIEAIKLLRPKLSSFCAQAQKSFSVPRGGIELDTYETKDLEYKPLDSELLLNCFNRRLGTSAAAREDAKEV